MKTPIYLFLAFALSLLQIACTPEVSVPDDFSSDLASPKKKPLITGKTVKTTLPITLNLYTAGGPLPSTDCPAPYNFLNIQTGAGTGNHLGSFTADLSFCVDPSELFDPTIINKELPYINAQGVLVAANGDEINIIGEGVVKTTTKPGYLFEFQDTLYIDGGTGRFMGASGMMVTDSYNRGDTTDHVWSGTITTVH